jgi:hypothetical protein
VGSKESFFPYLSVLDALMNVGPNRTMELIVNGTEKCQCWDEMVAERSLKQNSSIEDATVEGIDG